MKEDNIVIENMEIVKGNLAYEYVTDNILIDYIANLESYQSRLKEIHWNTSEDKTHVLTDELIGKVKSTQDELAEYYMGADGDKFPIGFLNIRKELNVKTLPELLTKLIVDTINVYKLCEKNPRLFGMKSILDNVLIYTNTYLYKETQK